MGFPLRPPLRTPRATGLRCPALGALNLKRRHLNEDQRASVASRLANLKQGDNQYKVDAQICATTSQSDAKVPVYKNGLYYTASKRYFRAAKTPPWGNLVL